MKTDVCDYVTERIINRLEAGEVPWINTRTKPLLLARSATTGKQYRGLNAFCSVTAATRAHSGQRSEPFKSSKAT